jgi:DEAD/DEAH box helicase domain-containing protein
MKAEELEDEYPDYEGQIEHIEEIPPQRAETRPVSEVIDSDKISNNLPFEGLFRHQAKSIELLKENNNVCVTTPTSSGKTLVYALDIARKYIQNDSSTALLVYPTKALSRDQEEEISKLYQELGLNIDIGVYDGDSSRDEKRRIRRESNVIITNFQGLNYYLPHHKKWSRIFRNLDTIVVDEAHTYTGVQGIHVSWLMRRLRRISEGLYGSEPNIILSSATIGNPSEHAKNLTGEEFKIVSEDGSPRGKRDLVIWNPPSYYDEDKDTLERRSSNRESSDVLSYLINQDVQSLMFAPARKTTELCSKWAEEELEKNYAGFYDVEPYNAGHRKDDRREVETDFKNGDIDGVVSTTALELGIDIGEVDATIMNGYPGRKASFWQQAGRSGRGRQDALSILVARHDSIDQFIVENPEFLLEGEVENAVVDLGNRHILEPHICAAANEIPLKFTRDVANYFRKGPIMEAINNLKSKGLIEGDIMDGEDVNYTGPSRPESNIDLYSTSDEQFDVYIDAGEDKYELPSVDASRAYREFHPHAIYMYKGNQYEVTSFDREKMEILLEYREVNYYTQSSRSVEVKNLEEEDEKSINDDIKIKKGKATIAESYATYTRVYFDRGDRESNLPTGLNEPIELKTDAIWIEISGEEATNIENASSVDGLAGSLHAAEHSLIKMSPTILTADSKNLGGLSTPYNDKTGKSTIFIYDGIEGGVGFSHEIYDQVSKLSKKTKSLVEECECNSDRGCPACTMSPMCGDNNEPMDTDGACYLLEKLN